MAFTGFQAIAGYYTNKYIIKYNDLSFSIIIGILLPDMDVVFALFCSLFINFENSLILFTNKITHSLFLILLIYLWGLIISEIKRNNLYTRITKGIIIGITIHILFDSLFSNQTIFILWPIDIKFNILSNFKPSNLFIQLTQLFDFILFRCYGWFLNRQIILQPSSNAVYNKLINKWMTIELYFFIIMGLLLVNQFKYFLLIWMILFSPSIIIAIILTYLIRNQLSFKK